MIPKVEAVAGWFPIRNLWKESFEKIQNNRIQNCLAPAPKEGFVPLLPSGSGGIESRSLQEPSNSGSDGYPINFKRRQSKIKSGN